jgi:glycerate 2-kinase
MTVLIAPDKFKGTLTAQQVCDSIEAGLKHSYPDLAVHKFPLADGGDGTLDLLLEHLKGRKIEVEVFNPIFTKIKSSYGLSKDGKTAFIEMANASGLRLVREKSRAILYSSTYGTGETIRHALDNNVKRIILGIGGSATNDAALGAAQALGYRFYNSKDELVDAVGDTLEKIVRIDNNGVHPRLKSTAITAICDVTNPFYGSHGAAYSYGPQKGASPSDIKKLDRGLMNVAALFEHQFKINVQNVSGSGAGGGFAGGAMVLLNATLKSGIDTIFEITGFEEAVKTADMIITGEGKIDTLTLDGKLLNGVSNLAKKYNKRIIAVAGQSTINDQQMLALGIETIYTLSSFANSESRAMEDAENVLRELSEKIVLTDERT